MTRQLTISLSAAAAAVVRRRLPALLAAVLLWWGSGAPASAARPDTLSARRLPAGVARQFASFVRDDAAAVALLSDADAAALSAAGLSRRLPASQCAAWQRCVWQAWQQACRASALRLPALRPLADARSGCWLLPDSLEPSAAMPFYWGTKGERPAAGYPLFLYLHGSGPKAAEWATGLRLAGMFDDAPSAYFIPQIPREGEYYRWWQRAKLYAWRHLLRSAMASDSIDPDRLYVFGISEGGYGSQRLASFLADYWAAAGPMAGGEPLRNVPVENLANLPLSLLTGADDRMFCRNVFTAAAGRALDSLAALRPGSFTHRVELIPGRGHGIDYRPTTPWLAQFRRQPYPRHFSWENIALDGVRRRGFYNLYLPEALATDAPRQYYEVSIAGNCVDIRAAQVDYATTARDSVWGIETAFSRTLTPLEHGALDVYLCDSLCDLSRRVTIRVNGRRLYRGRPACDLRHLVSSCARYADPRRLYPAMVRVEW